MSKSKISVAKLVGAFLLFFCSFSFSNSQTITHNIPDDGYVHVPLQFGFPYYGGVFTNSWMFDNGVVGFLDPASGGTGGQQYWAEPFRNDIGPRFHYMIAPLWTDLVNYGTGSFITEGTNEFQRYTWQNISQWGYPDRLNTFSLEIRPTGYIGVNYELINVQGYPISTGTIGDATLGEWTQQQFLDGNQSLGLSLSNWSVNDTGVVDQCISNPLSSPTCSGYTEAMCVSNPLFSTTCSGYAAAYYTQQCSINTLYDPGCPGYAQAYLDYQCSVNSLYSTSCPGYETAYFNQQCSLNPLYNQSCPGYADAYYVQQCNLNPLYDTGCTGYETAYFNQQCSLNPLYNNQCVGYAEAYFAQQCSLNTLYNQQCPGYAQAYFDQQCSLDGLYDRQCPNYAQAYAAQQLLNPPAVTNEPVVIVQVETTTPAVVSDPVINDVITTTSTSTSPAQSTTATVPLVTTPAPVTTAAAAAPKEEKANDTSANTSSSSTSSTSSSSSEKKDEPKTTRQQLAERRLEAARAKAVEQGKNLANEMSTVATMEAQVAVQNVMISAMGFVPGFDAYNKSTLPDGINYRPYEVYRGQQNVDNQRLLRGLTAGTDRTHNQMVEQQYELGK